MRNLTPRILPTRPIAKIESMRPNDNLTLAVDLDFGYGSCRMIGIKIRFYSYKIQAVYDTKQDTLLCD
jgi:hypothetical protein